MGCYWAYEDFTHNTLFTAGTLLYVLREAGFKDIEFIDVDGLMGGRSGWHGWRKRVRRLWLKVYKKKVAFWMNVTGCYYHAPSPIVYTWEVKCIARK